MADTSTDLSDALEMTTDPDGIGSPPQATELLEGIEEDDSPSVEIPLSVERDFMAVLWPLTIFVLAPLALLGVAGLLWLLVQTAIR